MAGGCCSSDALLSEPMPLRRGLKPKPNAYAHRGSGRWPKGSVRQLTAQEKLNDTAGDVLAVVHFVKRLAMKLDDRRMERSIYKVAKDANVNPQTLNNFIDGETWGDVAIIYRLERGLNEALWSHDHLSPTPRPRDYLAPGHHWPDGELKPGTPPHVHFTKQLAVELNNIRGENSSQWLAYQTQCDETAVIDFLAGETFEDIEFIFRIEHALKKTLWSHDHLTAEWTDRINDSEQT